MISVKIGYCEIGYTVHFRGMHVLCIGGMCCVTVDMCCVICVLLLAIGACVEKRGYVF